MKNLFLLIIVIFGLQTIAAQSNNIDKQHHLSIANQNLLSKLVMSDLIQNHNSLNYSALDKPSKQQKSTATFSHQSLQGFSNTDTKQNNNATIYVIKKGNSRIIQTVPKENKPITKNQAAVLSAILGIQN